MKSSYTAAAIAIVVLVLWMASGMLASDNDTSDQTEANKQTSLMKVEIIEVSPESMQRKIELQGQLEPARRLHIRAEIAGIVSKLHVSKGQTVAANDPLMDLTLDGRDTELRQAQAAFTSAVSEEKAAASLREQGLQSKVQLEQAQSQLERARAQLARVELDIANTQITAPFAGIINTLPIEQGELVERGGVVAELVDNTSLKANAQAAQQTIAQLKIGQAVTVSLLTGEELPGEITFISAVANSQTRSFAIEAVVDNPDGTVSAGVSASIQVPIQKVEAVFISPSTLSLGNNGELGVKIVNSDNIVEFVPIKLVSTSLEGAWVTGIVPNSRLVTLGQGFINPGQKVDPKLSTSNKNSAS
ncbi:MAG: efflux RND transporter periplasmic adaptor subunit [Granulosicoccaceae bacterium]